MTSVLFVDNEKNVLEAFKLLLEDHYKITVCDSGQQAMKLIKESDFDAAVLDVDLGDMNGIEILREIKNRQSNTEVIMLSAHEKRDYIVESLRLGAKDYLIKPLEKDEMRNAIESALDRRIISSTIEKGSLKLSGIALERLSEKEINIMRLVSNGKSDKEISEETNEDLQKIKYSLRKIYLKLDVEGRPEAVTVTFK